MVIKDDGEKQRHYEQQYEHVRVACADNQQEKEAHDKNHELGRDHVRENRTHEKPILTLKKRQAGWAVMPDVKRLRDDARLATRGAT